MNSFGLIYKTTIFGASHEPYCGVLIDGVKPGLKLEVADFIPSLSRRQPGLYGTPRKEADTPILVSGIYNDYTTGAPLLIMYESKNVRSSDYEKLINHPRPSHADFVAFNKYHGFNDPRGGGAFSGRLTLGLVSSGVVAKKIYDCDITSEIVSISNVYDKSKFKEVLEKAKNNLDSVGGIIRITIKGVKIGLGEPYFDSLESVLSHALFSVGAVKGVSFGTGFKGTEMLGSEFNDLIIDEIGHTKTNNNGGINGGISNGNDIIINVAIKPTPSIGKAQETYNFKDKKIETLEIGGRHDVAIILRMQVVLESVCQMALTDMYLRGLVYENN